MSKATPPQPVVLVTGASRGLGAATALALAELGAHVVLTARSAERLQQVAQQAASYGVRALSLPADLGDPAAPERVVAQAVEAFGRLNALVNNAGVITPLAPVAHAESDAWEHNWRVNLLAPVMLVRHALPYLRQSRGRVINVSSGAAVHAFAGWGAYCSAKAALNHFTAVLAAEEPEVTAIAFRPGIVDTDMQAVIRAQGAEAMPPALYQRFLDYKAKGRLVAPEIVGRILAHLALAAPAEWSGRFIAYYEEPAKSWLQARRVPVP